MENIKKNSQDSPSGPTHENEVSRRSDKCFSRYAVHYFDRSSRHLWACYPEPLIGLENISFRIRADHILRGGLSCFLCVCLFLLLLFFI